MPSTYSLLEGQIYSAYENCSSGKEAVTLYQTFRDKVNELNTSDPEDNEGNTMLNAGQAVLLQSFNINQQKAYFNRLQSSHTPATIEASTNNEETTMSNATAVTTSSFDIESMNITELAELQLKIAQRMSQLLAEANTVLKECTVEADIESAPEVVAELEALAKSDLELHIEAELEKAHEVKRAKMAKASRVKKPAAKAEQATTPKTVESALPASPSVESSDVSTMSYKDLQKFISAKTKECAGAKTQAQKVAREYGAKSWSTTGRKGYEEIYRLITA